MNALHQEGNHYLHYKEGKQTVLYIEMMPMIEKEEAQFLKTLFESFIKVNIDKLLEEG